jgi:hypothetical protein
MLVAAVRRADQVTTPSRFLEAEARRWGARQVRYLSNGAPTALLGVAPRPEGRRVGYLGTIAEWLDFDLVERMAAELTDATIELVGPVETSVADRAAGLRRYPNVKLSPPVPGPAIGEVLSRFAVGIIPFRLTPLTRAVNPNKLYEYAALDLPIVATPFSDDVTAFRPAVDAPETPEAFVATVRERLAGVGRRGTRSVAEAHTWAAIGAEFAAALRSVARRPASEASGRVL